MKITNLVRELNTIDALNNSMLWMISTNQGSISSRLKMLRIAQGYGLYQRFFIMSLKLWMIWITSGYELRALDALNSFRLWLTWTTLNSELWTVKAMKNSGVWMTRATFGRELNVLDAMNNPGLYMYEWFGILWARGSRCYEQLRPLDDMNDSWSLAQGSKCYE